MNAPRLLPSKPGQILALLSASVVIMLVVGGCGTDGPTTDSPESELTTDLSSNESDQQTEIDAEEVQGDGGESEDAEDPSSGEVTTDSDAGDGDQDEPAPEPPEAAPSTELVPAASGKAVLGADGCVMPESTISLTLTKDGDQADTTQISFEYESGSFFFPFELPMEDGCCDLALSYTKAADGSTFEDDELSCAPGDDVPCFVFACSPGDPPQPDPKGRIFGSTNCVDAGSVIEMYGDGDGDGQIDTTGANTTAAFSQTVSGSSFVLDFDPEPYLDPATDIAHLVFQASFNGRVYQRPVECTYGESVSDVGCVRKVCN